MLIPEIGLGVEIYFCLSKKQVHKSGFLYTNSKKYRMSIGSTLDHSISYSCKVYAKCDLDEILWMGIMDLHTCTQEEGNRRKIGQLVYKGVAWDASELIFQFLPDRILAEVEKYGVFDSSHPPIVPRGAGPWVRISVQLRSSNAIFHILVPRARLCTHHALGLKRS